MYLGSVADFQSNEANVNARSAELVSRLPREAITPGSSINALVRQVVDSQLKAFEGKNPPVPVPPVGGGVPGEIRRALTDLLATAQPELIAAIQSSVKAGLTN